MNPRPHLKHLSLLLALMISLSACKTSEEIRREEEVKSLSMQVSQSQQLNASALTRLQNVEQALSRVQGQTEENSYSLDNRLKSLEEKIKLLEEERQQHQELIEQLKKQLSEQKAFLKDITEALEELSQKPPSSSSSKKSSSQRWKSPLDRAQANYRVKNYAFAKKLLLGLKEDDSLSSAERASVFYHLGKIAFAQKKYDEALGYFSKLYTDYPKSKLTPDGLLTLGKSFRAQKLADDAKNSFDELVSKYPQTKAAQEAQKLLEKL